MARRPHVPVPVEVGPDNAPRAFTYKGTNYLVHVIGRWHLHDRWWMPAAERGHVKPPHRTPCAVLQRRKA